MGCRRRFCCRFWSCCGCRFCCRFGFNYYRFLKYNFTEHRGILPGGVVPVGPTVSACAAAGIGRLVVDLDIETDDSSGFHIDSAVEGFESEGSFIYETGFGYDGNQLVAILKRFDAGVGTGEAGVFNIVGFEAEINDVICRVIVYIGVERVEIDLGAVTPGNIAVKIMLGIVYFDVEIKSILIPERAIRR